jgi:hypothetical protein
VFSNIQPQIQQVKELRLGSTRHVRFAGFGALQTGTAVGSDFLAEASAIVEIAVKLHKRVLSI